MKIPKIELPKFERKIREPDPPGVTVPAWLVGGTKFAAWIATVVLIYFLFLYTLDIARDRAGALHLTHAGTWVGEITFWVPYIGAFALVAVGIPYVAKIAIPTFVSLSWRQDPTAKVWSLLIAIAVSLVVISGTFAVQGHTIMERDRDAAVAVEQVQQGRSVIEAQIESKRQELADMMNNRNAYLAQAASVGAAEWQRSYIDATPANDPQRDRIVRALGAARAADTVREEIEGLRAQLAQAPAVASVQREVVTESTGWIASTLGWLEGVRAILLSFVMDIVALIMPLIALRLEQARNRQLGMAKGVPLHRYMIPDMSQPDKPGYVPPEERRVEPMDAGYKGPVIYEEDGSESRWVEGYVRKKDGKWIPGHYRPTGKKKPREIEVTVGGQTFTSTEASEASTSGDGGSNRIAVGADGLGGVMESVDALEDSAENNSDDARKSHPQGSAGDNDPITAVAESVAQPDATGHEEEVTEALENFVHADSPEYPQEYLEALDTLAGSDGEQSVDSEAQGDEAEQQSDYEHDEPQTNPARLIAPVAAE